MKLPFFQTMCEVCGQPVGGVPGHTECAKIIQKRHANDKRPRKKRANYTDKVISNLLKSIGE